QIEAWMDDIWEGPVWEPELRKRIIELALRHGLASAYTSFLAVEYRSKAEREQARGAVAIPIPQYLPQGMPAEASPQGIPAAPSPGGTRSIHDKLSRVRAPRLHISYQVQTAGAADKRELPFVIGVLGGFSGRAGRPLKPLKDRKFLQI